MEEVAFLRQNMVRDWTTSEDIFCLQTVWDEDAPSSFSWVYVAYGLCAREREREGVYAAKRSAYVGCFSKHYVPCFWFHLLQIPTTWWEVDFCVREIFWNGSLVGFEEFLYCTWYMDVSGVFLPIYDIYIIYIYTYPDLCIPIYVFVCLFFYSFNHVLREMIRFHHNCLRTRSFRV